jgi:bifunctional UDP-N-acetylglucosamine pyrophosphorylase/glucosamine-1-phosphate N-acetyltransferase
LSRKAEELMAAGVTILEPQRTTIESTVSVGSDVIVHPEVALLGSTRISSGCVIQQGAWLRDCDLGPGCVVEPYSVLDGARLSASCRIGPFARLRPGSVLEERVKVGNFVEVKASQLRAGVKASHLAYLGDATVGEETNVGAGVITCNYDGTRKHPTIIGEDVFVGSDAQLVAPVTVGRGAYVGAGATVTGDVPEGALALSRVPQVNVEGWVERRKAKNREKHAAGHKG